VTLPMKSICPVPLSLMKKMNGWSHLGSISSTCSLAAFLHANALVHSTCILQQYYSQLYLYTQLEVTANFYAVQLFSSVGHIAPFLVSRGPNFSQKGKVKAKKIAFAGPYVATSCSMACVSKISINLVAQKLLIEHWWNWHLKTLLYDLLPIDKPVAAPASVPCS
jgi:hypothetical protein